MSPLRIHLRVPDYTAQSFPGPILQYTLDFDPDYMIVVYCTYLLHLVSFSSFLGWPRYAHCYLQTLWSNERSLIISSRELQYWGVKNNFSGKLKRFKNLALAFGGPDQAFRGHILQYTPVLWPGLWSSFTAHICFILCHSWVDHVIWNTSICELWMLIISSRVK
jgi:hypothetical protein